jgi:TolA-binding protein
LGWDARKQIGEILYTRQDKHSESIQHYQELVRLRPQAPEVPEFLYRIADSYFQGWAFDSALEVFERVQKECAGSPWAEKAAYQLGMVWLTRGEQRPGSRFSSQEKETYREAIRLFEAFIQKYPKSVQVPEATFGIAVALEELDQLDQSLSVLETIQSTYPTPNVVQIRRIRLKERISRRRR